MGDDDDGCGASEWSESHVLRDATRSGGPGQERHGGGDGTWENRDDGDQPMGSGEWWDMSRADWEAGVRWESCGYGKWTRSPTAWADSWEAERAQEEEAAEQPAAARRRLEPTRPPQEPTAEGTGGQAAAASANGTRRLQQGNYVQSVIAAAIAAGVQPLTAAGEDLQLLDENQLAAWAAENLPEDAQLYSWRCGSCWRGAHPRALRSTQEQRCRELLRAWTRRLGASRCATRGPATPSYCRRYLQWGYALVLSRLHPGLLRFCLPCALRGAQRGHRTHHCRRSPRW